MLRLRVWLRAYSTDEPGTIEEFLDRSDDFMIRHRWIREGPAGDEHDIVSLAQPRMQAANSLSQPAFHLVATHSFPDTPPHREPVAVLSQLIGNEAHDEQPVTD